MRKENRTKNSLKEGRTVLGTFVKISDASVVEILALAGFDFFILDNEHVAMNPESMVNMIRAADAAGIDSIIRVRENHPNDILHALDSGASGVQIPHINTKEHAVSAVQSVKYSPLGHRGFAPSHRAAGYGFINSQEYARHSNENTLISCYCETLEAVANLDAILEVQHIDVTFIGPFDLSQSLGVPGQARHPKVVECMDGIINKSKKAGRPVGIIASDPADAKIWIEKGVQYITISSDQGMIANQGRNLIRDLNSNPGKARKNETEIFD